MLKTLEKLETYILYGVILLLPIIFLPIFANPYVPAKLAVLAFGISLVLFLKAIRVISSGKLDLSVGNFDFPVILIAGAYLASAILRTPNKMEAFFLPGNASAILGAALLYFLINQLKEKEKRLVRFFVFASALIFSVIVLLVAAGAFINIAQLPAYMRSDVFNPAGGVLPAAIFLTALIPLGLGLILSEKEVARKIFLSVSGVLVTLALAYSIFNSLPGKPSEPRLPSLQTSWAITIDSLKESPIFGIGPGNYITAFNRYRPLAYNQGDLWAARFTSASNFYFTALTETGLLGAAGLILLLLAVFRVLRADLRQRKLVGWGLSASTNLISLVLLSLLLAIFPAGTTLIVLLFVLLALTASVKKTKINLASSIQEPGPAGTTPLSSGRIVSRIPAILASLPVIIAVLFFAFYASRTLAAEARFKQALDALVQNDARTTYETMRAAINLNPSVDRYHASYAQVNLALANSVAQKQDLTEQDRADITQLVQQAIREAKATVALNPTRAANWVILGTTYRNIIPFAQGADVFAVQTYSQAVALDPINPNLRIALGGVHYAQGNFDDAIRAFELAIAAKPDLANAHYNLAFALREDGKIDRAIREMTIVLSLVDPQTKDYELARTALEDLEKRRVEITSEAAETLTPPQPAEEPVLEPPLELPEEAEPPSGPEAETPEVSPSPTPTPTPTPTG